MDWHWMSHALTYIINHVALLANSNPKNPCPPLYNYNNAKSIPNHFFYVTKCTKLQAPTPCPLKLTSTPTWCKIFHQYLIKQRKYGPTHFRVQIIMCPFILPEMPSLHCNSPPIFPVQNCPLRDIQKNGPVSQ